MPTTNAVQEPEAETAACMHACRGLQRGAPEYSCVLAGLLIFQKRAFWASTTRPVALSSLVSFLVKALPQGFSSAGSSSVSTCGWNERVHTPQAGAQPHSSHTASCACSIIAARGHPTSRTTGGPVGGLCDAWSVSSSSAKHAPGSMRGGPRGADLGDDQVPAALRAVHGHVDARSKQVLVVGRHYVGVHLPQHAGKPARPSRAASLLTAQQCGMPLQHSGGVQTPL